MAVMMNARGTTANDFRIGHNGTGSITAGNLSLKSNNFTQTFKSNAAAIANVEWTVPAADGLSGNVLTTNGAGQLSWAPFGAASTIVERNISPTVSFANGEIMFSHTNTVSSNPNLTYNIITNTLSVPNIRVGTATFGNVTYQVQNNVANHQLPIATVDYKTVEYVVYIKQNSTGFVRSVKLFGMFDGTNIHSTAYATLESGTSAGTVTCSLVVNAGNIVLAASLTGATGADTLDVTATIRTV